MPNNASDRSKAFLRAAQRGDLNQLKNLARQYNIDDWTIYRHAVSGDTALHIAAREGYLQVAEYLCNHWAHPAFKVDATNKDMKRPLHEASQFARSDIVDFLIQQGASVDSLKRADWTPLMLACTRNGPDALKCIISLLKAGADPMIRNKDGWISLHIACRVGNIAIIKLLITEKPGSVTTTTKNGRTTLHIAAFHGCLDAMDFLMSTQSGLVEACDSSGSTPLHEAVKSGNFDGFQRLIRQGADIQKVDSIGQTILHIAASVGNAHVIDYILTNKLIDINCKDNFNLTPLTVAQRNKLDLGVVDLLISYMERK